MGLMTVLAVEGSSVAVLDGSNFDELVTSTDTLWLVKFYAPWCGHCKRLAPVLDELATELMEPNTRIGKVDCTVESALKSRYDVSGYPTLILTRGVEQWQYDGQRTKEAIHEVIERVSRPAVSELHSKAELEDLLKRGVVFLLGRAEGVAAGPGHELFNQIAQARKHTETFASAPPALVDSFLRTPNAELPLVAKLEKGEAPALLQLGSIDTPGALSDWVNDHRFPLTSLVDRHNFGDLLGKGSSYLAMLVLDPEPSCASQPDGCESRPLDSDLTSSGIAAELRAVARDEEFSASFRFAFMDGAKWGPYLEHNHRLSRAQLPMLMVMRGGSSRSFVCDLNSSAVDAESIRSFLRDVSAGQLRFEYLGAWGLPDRWWHFFLAYVPQLAVLDVLPHYSLTVLLGLTVLYLVYKLLMYEPEPHPAYAQRSTKTD